MNLEKDKLYNIETRENLPDDLEAISINLSPQLVLMAYPLGLFPWHQDDQYFYWFSPDPRMVLFPDRVKVSKSMRNVLNQKKHRITYNQAFSKVVDMCASTKRKNQDDTWISNDFKAVYLELHKRGFAHSVEAWNEDNQLVGGLYGLTIGKLFFGESMFSTEKNASKSCFINWAQKLKKENFTLIDCQAVNNHLKTLGAEEISKKEFLKILSINF